MKQRLSISLVKDFYKQDEKILNIANCKQPKYINIIGGEGVLFIRREAEEKLPDWVYFLTENQSEVSDTDFSKTKTSGAVLKVLILNRIFLVSFGTGFHLINNDCIEKDFGLKVTINSVDPDKLRSIDKSNYEDNPLNTRNQSTKEVSIKGFNIDREMDLLSTLTGKSNVNIFGDIVTGKDSLIINVETKVSAIKEILSEAFIRFKMKPPAAFEWIDNVKRVNDSDVSDILDLEIDNYLIDFNLCKDFWLGEPEIVDWSKQSGYCFESRSNEYQTTLSLKSLYSLYKAKGISTNVNEFKSHYIYVIDDNEKAYKKWPVYDCLYAEVSYDNNCYILRAGEWFKVNVDFINRVDGFLSSVKPYERVLPIYNHDREEFYNSYVHNLGVGFVSLDQSNIQQGGKHDKVEFCDLINQKELIHVKFYRSSSTLSHLFSQGFVSAESFLSNKVFREKLLKILPDNLKSINPSFRPNAYEFTVVFAIATKKELPKELPFFSKLTLKNIIKSLEMYGFNVRMSKIETDENLLRKKLGKKGKETKRKTANC